MFARAERRDQSGVLRSSSGSERICARSESHSSFSRPLPSNSPWLSGMKKPQYFRSARTLEAKAARLGDALVELNVLLLTQLV